MTTEPAHFPDDPFVPALVIGTSEQVWTDADVWLTFLVSAQWGDEAPNRLFGAWLNQDGEAV